jgi:hypothetical protein
VHCGPESSAPSGDLLQEVPGGQLEHIVNPLALDEGPDGVFPASEKILKETPMKWTPGLIALALFGLWLSSDSFAQKESQSTKPPALVLETLSEKASYAIGYQIGQNFGNDLQLDLLGQGLQDAQASAKTLLTQEAMQQSLQEYQKMRQAREGEDNKAAGEAFLKANKEKDGVVSLPSGLQYKVMTEGTGPSLDRHRLGALPRDRHRRTRL